MKVVLKKDDEIIIINLETTSIAQFNQLIEQGYEIVEFIHCEL